MSDNVVLYKVPCKRCGTYIRLIARDFAPGSRFKCPGCGWKWKAHVTATGDEPHKRAWNETISRHWWVPWLLIAMFMLIEVWKAFR